MPMGAPMAIGTAFGAEGAGDLSRGGTDLAEHLGDHMVALNHQPVGVDLAGGMAVADVPRDAGQVGAGHLQQGFVGSHYFDQTPVGQHESIAVVERGGLRQIDQKRQPVRRGQHLAAQKAPVIGQLDPVTGIGPRSGAAHLLAKDWGHLGLFKTGNSAAPWAARRRVHRSAIHHPRAPHRSRG